MNILITGGAGFLGYHLAQFLKKKGHTLTLLDLHAFDKKEYPGNYNLVIGDVRDKRLVYSLAKRADVIIHAAAALPLEKAEEIRTTTVNGTRIVLQAALKNKVKRVIYISSTAVYGIPKVHPIYETDTLVGVGPYGESKIKAEQLCRQHIKKGLSVTIIRPKTFVGTGRLGVFEILFDWVHDGKKIPAIGSGNNKYQLLEVDDLVAAIYCAVTSRSKKMNTEFNIGAGEYGTVKSDLETLFKSAKSGSKIFPVPSLFVKTPLRILEALHLSPLYRWVYDTADKDSFVSIEKAKKILKWKPKYSNAQALIRSYCWYLKHYKNIKSKRAGFTHTVGWKQGALGIVKRFM